MLDFVLLLCIQTIRVPSHCLLHFPALYITSSLPLPEGRASPAWERSAKYLPTPLPVINVVSLTGPLASSYFSTCSLFVCWDSPRFREKLRELLHGPLFAATSVASLWLVSRQSVRDLHPQVS
jgi:hypothetical protein